MSVARLRCAHWLLGRRVRAQEGACEWLVAPRGGFRHPLAAHAPTAQNYMKEKNEAGLQTDYIEHRKNHKHQIYSKNFWQYKMPDALRRKKKTKRRTKTPILPNYHL
jgi:hypothetical protein